MAFLFVFGNIYFRFLFICSLSGKDTQASWFYDLMAGQQRKQATKFQNPLQ